MSGVDYSERHDGQLIKVLEVVEDGRVFYGEPRMVAPLGSRSPILSNSNAAM